MDPVGPDLAGPDLVGPVVHKAKLDAGPSSSVSERIAQFDKQLSLRVHGGGLWVPRWILRCLEYSCDGLWAIPLTAAMWVAPVLLDKVELRNFLFNLFVAFLVDLAIVGVIKGLVRRPRPIYNKGMHLVMSVDHYSFPSGHSSRALMIAVIVWFYLPLWKSLLVSQEVFWKGLVENWGFYEEKGNLPALEACASVVILLWALATAASRVVLGRHYVLDVLMGCLVGIFEAWFVHRALYVPHHVSQAIHDWLLGVFDHWIVRN